MHADFNGFYASVACLLDPALRGRPVAVAGDPAARHGIILAKNETAKRFGVKTGEAIWQARRKCPALVTVKPDFPAYQRFSRLGREIYAEYSDRVEAFGLDENWIDVTAITNDFTDARRIADEIRLRVRDELGITVSIGVAPNKVFAKLGSDMKKPDAVTLITPQNYREKVWPLPASDLLYIGRATAEKLRRMGVDTIGELAAMPASLLRSHFGKVGLMLHDFANGRDSVPVERMDAQREAKSIGNGVTTPRDLTCEQDVYLTITMLCESVAARLRANGQRARTVHLSVRDAGLFSFTRQAKLEKPSNLTMELATLAMALFRANYHWQTPVRSLSVGTSELIGPNTPAQLSLFSDEAARDRLARAEAAVDDIRRRFGYHSIGRAIFLTDTDIGGLNPREENTIHPSGWRRTIAEEEP
ncbi:MAG: DNA polymerase IV [bacterium]|nr:DNA polymerase IV [bacterium]